MIIYIILKSRSAEMPSQYFISSPEPKVERFGAVVKPRTLGREVPGSSSNNGLFLEMR